MFYNSNRHLSSKAWIRASLLNLIPEFILNPIANIGWKYSPGISAGDAMRFKEETGLPVIANGGFQEKDLIESTLSECKADLIAMARPLL